MPRRAKGPRLYLRHWRGKSSSWVILDRGKEVGTGCSESDREGAERALGRYLQDKYEPPKNRGRLSDIVIADVLNIYLREHAPHVANPEFLAYTAGPALEWWGTKSLADIRGQTCREYVDWRCKQGVSDQTARHDLKTLRAAINHYHREYGPLDAVPALTLPAKAAPKDRWLTRKEAARLLWAARRHQRLARFIIIGYYTGTRRSAILALKWVPSLHTGYFDLEAGVMYRSGARERASNKRKPPCKIPDGLMPHLKRWRAADMARGWTDVCHLDGAASSSIKTSWRNARVRAGLGKDVNRHTLRHTCCTWLMHAGVPVAEAAGFVGMSIETFDKVYGHHSADHQSRAAARTKRPTKSQGTP